MKYPIYGTSVNNESVKTQIIERVKLHFGKFLPIHTPLNVHIRDEYCHGFACEVEFKLFGKDKILESSIKEKRVAKVHSIPKTWWGSF